MNIGLGVILAGMLLVALVGLAAKASAATSTATAGAPTSTVSSGAPGSVGTSGPAAAQPPKGLAVPGIPADQAAGAIAEAATKYHVPLDVFYGMFSEETSLGSNITTSPTGAVGPFQFEPSTASAYGYPLTNSPSLAQFTQQAESAAHLLSDLYNQLGHSWFSALAGYNAGPGNLSAGSGYAARALSLGKQLVG